MDPRYAGAALAETVNSYRNGSGQWVLPAERVLGAYRVGELIQRYLMAAERGGPGALVAAHSQLQCHPWNDVNAEGQPLKLISTPCHHRLVSQCLSPLHGERQGVAHIGEATVEAQDGA